MSYKNILLSLDLSDTNENIKKVLDKSISISKDNNAIFHLIYVNVNFADLYTGLIQLDLSSMNNTIEENQLKRLKEIAETIDHPIEFHVGTGEVQQVLNEAIKQNDIDLLILGHHQDFVGKFFSTSKGILNRVSIDTMIIPLK